METYFTIFFSQQIIVNVFRNGQEPSFEFELIVESRDFIKGSGEGNYRNFFRQILISSFFQLKIVEIAPMIIEKFIERFLVLLLSFFDNKFNILHGKTEESGLIMLGICSAILFRRQFSTIAASFILFIEKRALTGTSTRKFPSFFCPNFDCNSSKSKS